MGPMIDWRQLHEHCDKAIAALTVANASTPLVAKDFLIYPPGRVIEAVAKCDPRHPLFSPGKGELCLIRISAASPTKELKSSKVPGKLRSASQGFAKHFTRYCASFTIRGFPRPHLQFPGSVPCLTVKVAVVAVALGIVMS